MSIIRIPEPITNITNTTVTAAKSIEVTDLETHVLLCAQRFDSLSKRINQIEIRIDDIVKQSKESRKMVIGAFVTLGTGIITSLITVVIKLS
jgi:hypothetical protein